MVVLISATIFMVISNLVTPVLCDTSASSVSTTTSPSAEQTTSSAPTKRRPKDDTMGIIVISVLCLIALLGLIVILAWNKCGKNPVDTELPTPLDQPEVKVEETQHSENIVQQPPPLHLPGPLKPAEPKSQVFTQKTQALSKYSASMEDTTQSQDERTASTQRSVSVKNTQYSVANPSSST